MNTHKPFVIERIFDATPERVWQAITDKQQMKQWYFDIADFKAEVGFRFSFEGKSDDKVYVHLCTVTEVIPGRKLAYSWTYQDYEGYSVVSMELFPEHGKTKLVLTHEGLETFPQNSKDFAADSFAKGWTYIIGTALGKFIDQH